MVVSNIYICFIKAAQCYYGGNTDTFLRMAQFASPPPIMTYNLNLPLVCAFLIALLESSHVQTLQPKTSTTEAIKSPRKYKKLYPTNDILKT